MSIIVDKIPVSQDRLVKFQEMVRNARKMRGPQATQAWVAQQAGVSQSFIVDVEGGPTPGMQLFPFWKYMTWLGFTMQQVGEILGLEKTLDVEDADQEMRMNTIRHSIKSLSPAKQRMVLESVEAMLRGLQ